MEKSLVEQQFGAHAAAYATSDVHAKGESLTRLVALAAPKADWAVLDVATGAGHTALAFAPHVARVVASDTTQEMLDETAKLAASRGLGNVETARSPAEALDFPEASFDLVTCRLALHHFRDVPAFLSACRRVLKPGGLLGLVDNISPDETFPGGLDRVTLRDVVITYNAFEKLRDPSHGRALTADELGELIQDCGFAIEHVERLAKPMGFGAWASRMGCSEKTTARLRALLEDGPESLRAFLTPHERDGGLWFTLQEAVIVARKCT